MESKVIKEFNIITAIDINRGIGNKGKLPWPNINIDMVYFRQHTCISPTVGQKNVVIMCRGTFDSINCKALKARINIVVSKSGKYKDKHDIAVATSFEEALKIAYSVSNLGIIWVIGGEGVYKEAIVHPDCNKLYITHIQEEYECDRFFPPIDSVRWERTWSKIEERGRVIFAIYKIKK